MLIKFTDFVLLQTYVLTDYRSTLSITVKSTLKFPFMRMFCLFLWGFTQVLFACFHAILWGLKKCTILLSCILFLPFLTHSALLWPFSQFVYMTCIFTLFIPWGLDLSLDIIFLSLQTFLSWGSACGKFSVVFCLFLYLKISFFLTHSWKVYCLIIVF